MFNLRRIGPAIVSILSAFVVVSPGVAVAQVLPDLTMLQPDEFRLELISGGVRRLRFSTYIVNLGPGRFDVVGSDPDPADSTKLTRVVQRLEQGGSWVTQPTPATMFYSGDGHDHWHIFGLQDFKLAFQATPNDRIATGVKTGFCFWDNVNLSGAPRFYTGATECHQQTNGTVPMGLSVNWGDKYPWSIGFQYIDISQLPYGNYCLTLTADPRGEFIEASNANNSTQTLISIQPGGVTVLAPNCAQGATPPATPTGLTATAGDRSVDLNWNDNTDTVTGYKVYRDANPGVNTTASAYTDTGLTNGTNYCYRVTAVNGSGNESSPSAQACATPIGPGRARRARRRSRPDREGEGQERQVGRLRHGDRPRRRGGSGGRRDRDRQLERCGESQRLGRHRQQRVGDARERRHHGRHERDLHRDERRGSRVDL